MSNTSRALKAIEIARKKGIKISNDNVESILATDKAERKLKTYKGEWYSVNSILANNWAIFYALIGGREAGKSYSVMNWAVNRKVKKKEKFKFYWMRLTDIQADKLLENNGNKFIDPDIRRKYGIKLMKRGNTLYSYDEVTEEDKNGDLKIRKTNSMEFCTILSCSTFYQSKGVGYFDNEYDGEYCIVLDEMNRESSEKNTFDIVYTFVNLLENIVRSTKINIRVFMIGNTLDEASDILSAFNFLPDTFGRYKLKSKRAVIDYIKPSRAYIERRKGTIADILMPNASTFTNEVEIDRSLLVNKRLRNKPEYIIKFSKSKDTWFTLWNDRIISTYNGEKTNVIAMRRYLDEVFNSQLVNTIIELFDSRSMKFVSLACFKQFQKNMRLLKK